jgi:hypothetical protein
MHFRRTLTAIALAGGLLFGQAAAPFATVAATVPPAIGQPGVSLAFDTTNKLLIITYTVQSATGAAVQLFSTSYNPHTLEGVVGGGFTVSAAGVTTITTHNLAADPLKYSIGTASTVLATCTTVTPVPTGQLACPVIPF